MPMSNGTSMQCPYRDVLLAAIEEWLVETAPGVGHVDRAKPLTFYGVSSLELLSLQIQLEQLILIRVDSEIFWEATSLTALVDTLCEERSRGGVGTHIQYGPAFREES